MALTPHRRLTDRRRPPRIVPRAHRRLLLASEVRYSGGAYCFALPRFGTHADADILGARLDRYLPRTDVHYDQPAALVALPRLDAQLGTHHADQASPSPTASGTSGSMPWSTSATTRATPPPNSATGRLPHCDFANSWSRS
ncbi:DUF6000 family protein [Streptomyces sp. DSM 41527]|uniref:DUF6000 family protein n=1 Tax=Streptomyces mooreae TaxID=3075523 RepID=A0ABU2T843_9ACTN|nr:DUF6000 family protein [Streptomyces sp. DSM 41527]MDT0457024.1 DUF6000 family protein [Streptomyces sp. DSM 41527]